MSDYQFENQLRSTKTPLLICDQSGSSPLTVFKKASCDEKTPLQFDGWTLFFALPVCQLIIDITPPNR